MFRLFDALPLAERLFVRARALSAPLHELERRAPNGHLLDVGCGHGLLTAMLALGSPQRTVLGIDPDERKVQLARDSVGQLPNVSFRCATAEQLGERGELDGAVIADVLYLVPVGEWRRLLGAVRALLRPGGVLLLKEAEADGSWRHQKTLLQEQLMVKLLGRTKASGGLGFQPRAVLEAEVTAAGFALTEVVALGEGFTTPHVLLCAKCV